MELVELRKDVSDIEKKIFYFKDSLNISEKELRVLEIDNIMLEENFWSDTERSTKLLSESKSIKKELEEFSELIFLLEQAKELLEYLKDTEDNDFYKELLDIVESLKVKEEEFSLRLLFSFEYDSSDAIIELHSGAGGTDATDWVELMLRMYERFFTKYGLSYTYLNYQAGDITGVKSASLKVSGEYAYGMLKGEKGVHRVIRISPFDPSGKRHTSFCSVDVIPEITDEESENIEINAEDLKIDTYRAQGAGGQHINTTDSAVRITHLPTGIVVQSQAERSQIKNKDTALKNLKSKLYQIKIEEKEKELQAIRGEQKDIGWGSQIRSYVFTPYTMVKDHRTNYEVSSVDKVMDGDIFDFIESYLHYLVKEK